MKAVGYTRLSQESDTSIGDQKREISDLADEHGFELKRIYDDGRRSSGFDEKRPEYIEMQADLEDGLADILIVRDRDRLSRDKRERSMLMYDLDDWGVELWTTADNQCVEFDSDEAWLIEMIRAYMDDVAKRREIQRARAKIQERVENGFHQGRPRTGTEFDDRREQLVPGDGFEKVLLAITLRDAGASYSELEDATGFSRGTLASILDRCEWYIELAEDHDKDFPDPTEQAGLV